MTDLVTQWKQLNKRHNQINEWYGQVYGSTDVGEEDFSEQPYAIASVSRLLENIIDDIMEQKIELVSRMTKDELEQI